MKDVLCNIVEESRAEYVELRLHERDENRIDMVGGELEEVYSTSYDGVGIRVLMDGSWGFSSTSSIDPKDVMRALRTAEKAARSCSELGGRKVSDLDRTTIAEGIYRADLDDSVRDHTLEEKLELVKSTDSDIRKGSEISSSRVLWNELMDHKVIVNNIGSRVELYDEKVEFYVVAYAGKGEDKVTGVESVGVTGGWKDLFSRRTPDEMVSKAVDTAEKLVTAKHPKGETTTVVLGPELVGLIAHEAVGHTVEADNVLAGSAAYGKLGKKVASELVTMVDDGAVDPHAAGWVPVDDEGTPVSRTEIISDGVLKNYLCDRETAAQLGVRPTGNARAFVYSDPPIVRMTNTFIEPREHSLEELLEDVEHGYFLKGAKGGQADANAEFTFGVQEAYLIKQGEITDLLKGVSISGSGFDVLESVDAVTSEFEMCMGSGYCGKLQRAKVDGGGPHIRCTATVGGKQEVS